MSHSLPTPGTYHSVKKNDMGPVVPAGSCLQDVLSEKKSKMQIGGCSALLFDSQMGGGGGNGC